MGEFSKFIFILFKKLFFSKQEYYFEYLELNKTLTTVEHNNNV